MIDSSQHISTITCTAAPRVWHFSAFHFIGTHGFQMPLMCPKGVGWGNMGYLIPEVAPGDWTIEILEVQIPIYARMCPGWGITLIGAYLFLKV